MRLRALDVRHWCCIESLSLTDLHDGIIVLSGPNRTGKSSLLQALRSCLFDHFHDSQDKTLLAAIPQRSKKTPRVSVEFELSQGRYRITKVFARTKEGCATLEQQTPAGWTVIERDKEAARRVRELLDVEKSQQGLYQLLWLRQGEVCLPEKVDERLAKGVEEVLGSLITGTDLAFKAKLDEECQRWFTPKQQREKEKSPLAELSVKLTEAEAAHQEVSRQIAEIEAAVRQYHEAKARAPELLRELEQAEAELTEAESSWNAVKERQFQHQLALQTRTQAAAALKQAADRVHEARQLAARAAEAKARLEEHQARRGDAEERRRLAADALRQAEDGLRQAQAELRAHDAGRQELEDRQALLAVAARLETLDATLARARELSAQLAELEGNLAGPNAPTQEQLEVIRQNRRKAESLRAKLEAGELRLVITPEGSAAPEVTVDGHAARARGAAPLLVRQRASVRFPGVGAVEISRGAADESLEQLARELADADRRYADSLVAFRLSPDGPMAVETLTRRRLERDAWAEKVAETKKDLARLAPQGLAALEEQRQAAAARRGPVLERHPDWQSWAPTQAEVDRLKAEFDRRRAELAARGERAEAAFTACAREHNAAEARLQELAHEVTRLEVQAQTLDAQLAKFGPPDHLEEARRQAQADFDRAEAEVRATALTEQEQLLQERYEAAKAALKARRERYEQNERTVCVLKDRLAGTEGLHQKRVQAEQAVVELRRLREREQLNAEAHRYLKEVFEEIHRQQVRQTVGPINDRVIKWVHHLGLTRYGELHFDSQLFPKGLVARDLADAPIAFDQESHGTMEQLGLLVRLAVGGLLSLKEPAVAVLDDPLVNTDDLKHRKMLEILQRAAQGDPGHAGPLQLLILTWRPERFDFLPGVQSINLAEKITYET